MTKLLATYKDAPTLKNAKAVRDYGRKHPFAVCLFAEASDYDLLGEALRHATAGSR